MKSIIASAFSAQNYPRHSGKSDQGDKGAPSRTLVNHRRNDSSCYGNHLFTSLGGAGLLNPQLKQTRVVQVSSP